MLPLPYFTMSRPPPLPPRSPRPSFSVYNSAPHPYYPPPPGQPGVNPLRAPPPLPPRPSSYESPNSPSYLNVSPPPLPPRPDPVPSSPPPAYSPLDPSQYTGINSAYQPTPFQYFNPPNQIPWANTPPPPPGPPTQAASSPNFQISPPSFPQHSHTEASPPEYSPPNSETPPGGIPQDTKSAAGIVHTSQAPMSTSPTNASSSQVILQPPASQSIPSSVPGPPARTDGLNEPQSNSISDASTSPAYPTTQYTGLEASVQSLHLSPSPPIPPKTLLVPNVVQNQQVGPNTPSPGTPYGHTYDNQAQSNRPSSGPSSEAVSPVPTTVPILASQPASSPRQYSTPQESPAPQQHDHGHGPALRSVTECIDIPMTFPTDWYWHPSAPDYLICSSCFVKHIHSTQKFQSVFQSARFTDGKPRVCRFSKPRMKDHVFPQALATGSLDAAVEFMQRRSSIPDCRGVEGVGRNSTAETEIKWYTAKAKAIRGFLACQACYEDLVLTNRVFAHQFEIAAEPDQRPPAGCIRACHMAIPFLENEYEARGKRHNNDWHGFAAAARMCLNDRQRCPRGQQVVTRGREWFVPKAGFPGLVMCSACYSDYVVHSGEEHKWQVAAALSQLTDHKARCARGSKIAIRFLFAQAHVKKDFALFWNAISKASLEETCDEQGIADGVWYTLPSNPSEFRVCASCYAMILEPLSISQFWVRKREEGRGGGGEQGKLLCCLNDAHPRLRGFIPRLLEMYYTLNPSPLEEYASIFAAIPLCSHDDPVKNRRWYGWSNCTICQECYLEFARHSPLAGMMELDNVLFEGDTRKLPTLSSYFLLLGRSLSPEILVSILYLPSLNALTKPRYYHSMQHVQPTNAQSLHRIRERKPTRPKTSTRLFRPSIDSLRSDYALDLNDPLLVVAGREVGVNPRHS